MLRSEVDWRVLEQMQDGGTMRDEVIGAGAAEFEDAWRIEDFLRSIAVARSTVAVYRRDLVAAVASGAADSGPSPRPT